jgi:hypothetical protein
VNVPAAPGRVVVRRAGSRCEYCGLSQAGLEAQFHVDHIEPVASGGPTVVENLALACVSCSLRKGARVELVDPKTGKLAAIFKSAAAAVERLFRVAWQSSFRENTGRSGDGGRAEAESSCGPGHLVRGSGAGPPSAGEVKSGRPAQQVLSAAQPGIVYPLSLVSLSRGGRMPFRF